MSDTDQDQAQKTEEPTAKKLSDARNKGDVAQSREIASWFMLLAGALAVAFFLPGSARRVIDATRRFVEQPHQISLEPEALRGLLADVVFTVGWALALPIGLFLLAAIAAPLVQFGILFAPERLKPSPQKISPIAGLKRMFSLRSVTELLKGLVKIGLVAVVAVVVILPTADRLELFPSMALPTTLGILYDLGLRVFAGSVIVMTALALLDLLYQHYEHHKKLRMTRQEVRDEFKQTEGDPHVKARLRQIRTERARQRMMAAVPGADVVITNPTHYAVALKYDRDLMEAPKLVAKGVDEVAARIRERAEECEVAIFENPPLARALHASVDLDDYIKPEHYQAVAEIIAFILGYTKERPRAVFVE